MYNEGDANQHTFVNNTQNVEPSHPEDAVNMTTQLDR
jgi:hypothetical protein